MSEQFNVFLDANIFIQMKYDFSKSPLFRLKKYVSLGIVRLFTNEIVIREVEAHIKKDVAENSAHLRNDIKKHCFREILNSNGYEVFNKDFRNEKWDELIISKFHKYLNDTNCFIMKNDNIKLNDIFEDYFRLIPPFQSNEDKKHEFPDATIIKSIKNYVSQNKIKMTIITNDDGWKNAFIDDENYTLFKDLKEALIHISSIYGGTEESVYLDYLGAESSSIIDNIYEWLYNIDWYEYYESDDSLYIDGIDYFEVENIKLILDGFEFIDKEEACARFKAIASIYLKYEYENYDCASYDKEDKVYYNVKHGTIKEKHICPIGFFVTVLNDEDGMDIGDYEFDDLELSSDTKVSSKAHEDFEDRVYNNEFLAEKTYTTCPDCGKPIGINNDVNGFCESCGNKH